MTNRPDPQNLVKIEAYRMGAALFTNPEHGDRWSYTIQYGHGDREPECPLQTVDEMELHRQGLISRPREFTLRDLSPEAAHALMERVMTARAKARIEILRRHIKELEWEVGAIAGALGRETDLPADELAMLRELAEWAPAKERGPVVGTIKERIVEVVKAAGRGGISVKEIVAKTGLDRRTTDRWLFSASAKQVPQLRKAGKARYRWEPGIAGHHPTEG